jgi:SP family general alpha glucoside:H+ symporter-like MFS transporter
MPSTWRTLSFDEHLKLSQALLISQLNPKAVGWSILLSTAVIMEGYDVVLLSSFYALPQFNKKYGVLTPDGTYTVPAPWKSGLSNGALCGEILGLFINGIVSEKFGYRKTMITSLAMMIAFIFIPFFSHNIQTLLVGEILCGIPWGVFQTLTTAYASEVCPVALRAYLCTYVNLCWVIGQFIASGVLRGILSRPDQWAYREYSPTLQTFSTQKLTSSRHPLCNSMALAPSHPNRMHFCSRISLVARPSRPH